MPIHFRTTLPLLKTYSKSSTRGVWISNGTAHYSPGYHMYTSWISHAHLMGITCTPHGYHMHTSWISHAHLMGITCTPHGYHMHTSWVSHAHLMGITCTPHGYHMHTSWVSHAHLMGITRTPPIHLEITLPLWKGCTGGVWISNGVAQCC